jgi:excisionase family DNA binding protein
MLNEKEGAVLIIKEACDYLRISRPAYAKYLQTGRIKGTKAGKGWRVLKSELERFLKEENGHEPLKNATTEDYTGSPIQKGNRIAKKFLRLRVVKKVRGKNCLKCGHRVILKKGFFLCEACRKSNAHVADLGNLYQSYLTEELRTFRLGQHG